MLTYLKLKYHTLADNARLQKKQLLPFIIAKFSKTLFVVLFLFADLGITLLLLPFLILYVAAAHKRKKNNIMWSIGLEHVVNKTIWRKQLYHAQGYTTDVFSFENTHESEKNEAVNIIKYSKFIWLDTFLFARRIKNDLPKIVEIYFEGNVWRQYFAVILLKKAKVFTVAIERGIWYFIDKGQYNKFQRTPVIIVLKKVDLVLYRENGTKELYDKFGVLTNGFVFDYNRVPVNQNPNFGNPDTISTPIVLFLNSFKGFRKVDLLISAIPLVVEKIPNVVFKIIGAKDSAEKEVYEKIAFEANGISTKNVEIQCWSTNPKPFFNEAHVYLLPTTLIFCNYSLLEAMECGIPPIVTQADQVEKLVQHGINGWVCDYTKESLADAIIEVLSNKELHQKFAKASRDLILETYDDKDRLQPVLNGSKQFYKLNEN